MSSPPTPPAALPPSPVEASPLAPTPSLAHAVAQPDGDRGSNAPPSRTTMSEYDWDDLLASFPTDVPTSRSPHIRRPRSATVSMEIMRDDAQRAAAARVFLDGGEGASVPETAGACCEANAPAAPVAFPSIRPSLITPPPSLAPPVVQAVTATGELAAPRPLHATPAVTQLEDTVAAGPVVSTARKGKKRARIDSTSPSPSAAARTRPPPPHMDTPSHRQRLMLPQSGPALAPMEWAAPAASHGRLSMATRALIKETLLPPPLASARLSGAVRPNQNRLPPSQAARAAAASRGRFRDENAVPERPIFTMDIDLPLDASLAPIRAHAPYGAPLQSLDLNRVRFPDAFAHMGPLPEEVGGTQSDDDLWAQVDEVERPRGVLSVRDRPPTPHPIHSLSPGRATPPRVVSHSAAALAASFTPSQPIPIPAGPAQALGSVVGTATYNAAVNALLPSAASTLQFTSVPPGGFPTVYLADPDGLFRGMSPARGVALRGEAACFIARIHNLNSMTQQEARQATAAIATIVTHTTGESNPLVVAPERDTAVGPHARQGPNGISFGVLGISVESVRAMLHQSTWSTPIGTIHVSPAAIEVSPFMFVVGGFDHDHNGSILNAIFAVFSGPDVLPHIVQLVQTHPMYQNATPEEAARAILASLVVRVSTLQNGNLMAAVYCDPPTLSAARWVEWRARVAALPFPHPLNSTGHARRAPPCAACHGEDHPTHLCPFQYIPGWNAPPPGTTWAQPGFAPTQGAPQPPPPPPPPAGGAASRGRAHSGRRNANTPAFNGHRRDYQGGGDGRASGSGAGSNRGGHSGAGGGSNSPAF
ncbi:uncharacterized protein TRAVEDRAFT_45166 [Trametes versicolor FP-101664 SS1]|uniref:uncharacterized protein n=1 Tax=Trametes versicolor (strain FP-101664) TaxID=717944 RepID=UPI00046247F3|nr:uncharacterized protein TRAVEDRAFT_45166 [Trametes versicolor FP-101664 SS1]EIW62341.1 hypothetical protein TRAVEDRAFT_45166 [Trametes versicolor FP-101664 SS1]